MQYIHDTEEIVRKTGCVAVLGNFDGLHKGHQKLLECAKKEAKKNKLETVVFTFYPHPTKVLEHCTKSLLMTRENKKQMVDKLGIDVLIEYPFTKQLANKSPESFFKDILMDTLKVRVLVVGKNYYFGKDNAGDSKVLMELGKKYDVKICIVEPVVSEEQLISSSRIRTLILNGEIEEANQLLGHPYEVMGTVVKGRQLGRVIGFPTLNLEADEELIYPPKGVYATRVKVEERYYKGMTNIGYNPTVNGTKKMVETHLFDFNQSIYGKGIEIYFYHFIRFEQKFESIEALIQQLEQDKNQVMALFASK